MRFYILSAALLILCCSDSIISAQSIVPAPTDDTQLWNDLQVTVPLQKKVDLVLTGTFRLGRGVSHPVSERGGISIVYKPNKFFTFDTGYLYTASQPYRGRKSYGSNLIFTGTLKFPIGRFTISDRNQVERRFRNSRSDSTRYRNRLRIEHTAAVGNTKFNVFASNEVFYDWAPKEWVRNRFAVGANKKINRHLTGEIYYMRQNDGRSRPGDLHIIGTIFRVQL